MNRTYILLRHGEYGMGSGENLNPEGEDQIQRVSACLRDKIGIRPDAVFTSTKLRAHQSATIFAKVFNEAALAVEPSGGLCYNAWISFLQHVLPKIAAEKSTVVCVTHADIIDAHIGVLFNRDMLRSFEQGYKRIKKGNALVATFINTGGWHDIGQASSFQVVNGNGLVDPRL